MAENSAQILTFGDYAIDLAACEIRRLGEVTPVEPQVFDLIAFLAARPGRLITKDEIIEAVWGGRIVSDSAVATRINAARRALGDDGAKQQLIKTVRGRGFRFDAKVTPAGAPETPAASKSAPALDVRYCKSKDGVSLAFADQGSGPALVKAAHFLTHLQHDAESVLFGSWNDALSRDHHYVRYDARGNGMSDRDVQDFSFEAMVGDLESVVDAAGVERFVLFGASQGAAVSVAYAHRHPERVAGLILYGGYAAGWMKSPDRAHRERREAMLALARAAWDASNPAARQAFAALFLPHGSPEQIADFLEMLQLTTSAENAHQIMKTFSTIDVRDLLPQIAAPTLVIHCDGDAVAPFSAGRVFATAIPGARMVMLQGENHVILDADPGWPKFVSEIRRFVSDCNAGA